MRAAPLLLALLAACGDALPSGGEDLALRFETIAKEVPLGSAFALTVMRRWTKDLEPAAFDERLLAPLSLRTVERTRRESETHVEERIHFDAHLFSLGTTQVGPATLRARPRAGGAERTAVSNSLELRSIPALDASNPGPPELPGPPIPPTFPWFSSLFVLVVALAALLLRRRPKTGPAPPREHAPEPATLPPGDMLAVGEFIRALVAARHAIPATARTTEELTRQLPALAPILLPCDQVKFARHSPSEEESASVRRHAEAFLRQS